MVCQCAALNAATDNHPDRVGLIADSAPECACEQHSMSEHSPGVVGPDETIVRMVCTPMHVHGKKNELMSSFFNHAFTKGLSAQRLERASDQELASWVNQFIGADPGMVWLGYVEAPSSAVMAAIREDAGREFCVYDAAYADNPAHLEICAARRIDEADRLEAKKKLRDAFGGGKLIGRRALKEGRVLALVHPELVAREVPARFQDVTG